MQILSFGDVERAARGECPPPKLCARGSSISVGSFDGPHLGHKAVLSAVVSSAREESLAAGVVTFSRPVPAFKSPRAYLGDVSTLRQRLESFERLGIDFAVVVDFSFDFARMEGESFLGAVERALNARVLTEGRDFRCGRGGECGAARVKKFADGRSMRAVFLDGVEVGGERAGSSAIRAMVSRGDVEGASRALGAPFALDCEGVEWTESRGALRARRSAFIQAFPADARYSVVVESEALSRASELSIEDGILSLGAAEGRVKSIKFERRL